MSLLRDSARAINERFNLVGFYSLAALLLRITLSSAGDDPLWAALFGMALVVDLGTACGIMGLVVQAAAGRGEPVPFSRYAAGLFLPLVWLWLRVLVIVSLLVALVVAVYQMSHGGSLPPEEALTKVIYWGTPCFDFLQRILWLYSVPLCIVARIMGEHRATLRGGWAILRARPADSARLIMLLLLISALEGALHYARGPKGQDVPPDVPEGLILLVTSYLDLVVLFGATRVVLSRIDSGFGDGVRPAAAARAPGPPA